jgi:predicted metal-dependent phosphoesterase TrpH
MFADLHLHTNFSDGTYTPEELAAQGRAHGLAAMALTDHDTVAGCPRMAAACESLGIEFIAGTELTAEHNGVEVHLLGYCLDLQNETFLKELTRFQDVRRKRIIEMTGKLNDLGVPLTAEKVFALANCRSPGRPHVARALVQEGFCATLDEAFERFLRNNRPAWVPKFKMSAATAIDLIHLADGVAVMAHPGLNRTDDVIPEVVAAGLDGLECFHSKHSSATSNHYLQIADQFGLLVSGGSDCHGMNKGKPLIGTVRIPYRHVEKIKQAAAARKAAKQAPQRHAPSTI